MLAVSDTNRDALVIFGVTGDLAFKQIFPALQNLARQHRLEILVLGMAREGWSPEPYRPGSWGPASAERLAADIGGWHNAVEGC